MFKSTKRVLSVLFAVLLPVLAALWTSVISKITPPIPHLASVYVSFIALLSGTLAYITHLKPARDLEKPVLAFLAILAESPIKLGERHRIGPRLNLMIVERPWYRLWSKRLRVVWQIGMDHFPDVNFVCKHDQGVAGEALRTKLPVLDNCETQDKTRFHFNQKQLSDTKHVKAIWSWPIYETDAKGRQTGNIVGVLNLDATTIGSFSILQQKHEAFESLSESFAKS